MSRFFQVLVLVSMVLGLGSHAVQAEPVTLILDWFPNPDHVPLYVAQDKGFFADEGLEVTLQPPSDPNDPLKLVAAGRVEFGISYQPSVIIARSEGLPVTTIGILIEHPLATIMFPKASNISKPADFKGKKIGYSVAPLENVLFEAVAEMGGLKRDDYELINVNFNLTPSLLSKRVDAVVGAFRNFETVQAEMEGLEVDILPLEENGVPDYYELVLITSDKNVSTQHGMVDRLMRAFAKAVEFTRTNPDEALAGFLNMNPNLRDELNTKAFALTLPFFPQDQDQSVKKWKDFQDFMFERKLITEKSAVGSLFTNRFAQ